MAAFYFALVLSVAFPFGPRCTNCERTASGLTVSHPAAVKAFKWVHPCPSTGKYDGSCPGYALNFKVPLACGGADIARNMEWNPKAQAKLKEHTGCHKPR